MNPFLRAHPRTLLAWMEWLYTRSANEATLSGPLGVWPEELGDFLRGLCRAYTPSDASPARITLAPGLLLPEPRLPRLPGTCLLLLSGGKDSLAAGALAEAAGYRVYAAHVRRINHSYPAERHHAAALAEAMGWPLLLLRPEHLARTRGQSVVKNEYALAFALAAHAERYGWLPEIVSLGVFRLDDCHVTSWYSDMEAALRSFASALTAAYGGGGVDGGSARAPRLVTWLDDERASIHTWATHPLLDRPGESVRALTASCMTPLYSKTLHRRRTLAAGVPLLPYDCGVCEKCYSRALLLSQLDPERFAYPDAYLANARVMLTKALRQPVWCHYHEALVTTLTADSARYLVDVVYGGALDGVAPRYNATPAVEPRVTRLARSPGM